MIYSEKDTIHFIDGSVATIVSKLGDGAQGDVYKVNWQNKEYALKLYKKRFLDGLKTNAKKFYNNLKENIESGSPSDSLIWPLNLTITNDDGTYGYLMELIPNDYLSFTKMIASPNILNPNYFFEPMIKAGINIVFAMKSIFRRGLTFQDFNDGSIYINTKTGDIKICDCDNVVANRKEVFILGKYQYMAPEIVLGKEKPNSNSDRFSLGVILFVLFFLTRPFDGKAYRSEIPDNKTNKKYFGENPVYILNKTNTSNGPIQGVHIPLLTLYPKYPQYLKELFYREFTDGIYDKNQRVSENEWLEVLARLLDDRIKCPKCNDEYFILNKNSSVQVCNECNGRTKMLTIVDEANNIMYIQAEKKLYDYHLTGINQLSKDSFNKIGTFGISKKDNNSLVIKNETLFNWKIKFLDKERDLLPGNMLKLYPNEEIIIKNKKFIIQ